MSTLTLIELIEEIEKHPALPVVYDTGEHPTKIGSWRGVYAELALSHEKEGSPLISTNLIKILEEAIGATYTGYKGGEFKMSKDTLVWVDNYGEYTDTIITKVKKVGEQIIIYTHEQEHPPI